MLSPIIRVRWCLILSIPCFFVHRSASARAPMSWPATARACAGHSAHHAHFHSLYAGLISGIASDYRTNLDPCPQARPN
ncbi:hypothetical protein BS50DRAFT_46216 [Corynespora cassiicola Philippines]|uniref:Secreted protein n=1 Tax=Corynespora cassiicola Philippines TaxID=1448308 RepID=A0A2T2NHF3_CORCC|nr:hypothetical protein BS50DRAFT_46216 [Corynespora cassiicola Philippines]